MPTGARSVLRSLINVCGRVGRQTPHDRHWRAHPAVRTGDELTLGERAADQLKRVFATWTALFGILIFLAIWILTGGFGHDAFPFILLNLCLSCLAALQCFILLIAAKRADQIAASVSLHTLENTEQLTALLQQNTALTEQIAALTREMHAHLATPPVAPDLPPPDAPSAEPFQPKSSPKLSPKPKRTRAT